MDADAAVTGEEGAPRVRWRARTSTGWMRLALLGWAVLALGFGLAVVALLSAALAGAVGAGPAFGAVWLVGLVPMLVVLRRADPADVGRDEGWSAHATRRLVVGTGDRSPVGKVLAAVLLGPPLAYAWLVIGLLELVGSFGV